MQKIFANIKIFLYLCVLIHFIMLHVDQKSATLKSSAGNKIPSEGLSPARHFSVESSSEILSTAADFSSQHRSPIKPNNLRRKFGHDYCAPSVYLITVTTTNRHPLLGLLRGDPDNANVEPTELGLAVISAFLDIESNALQSPGCRVQILQYQLMPDHFHGIIYVREQLPASYPLGNIIAAWKSECTQAYRRIARLKSSAGNKIPSESLSPARHFSVESSSEILSPAADFSSQSPSQQLPSLFSPGYNDRPLDHHNQLSHWFNYLHDNPRRLALKRANPDLFRIRRQIDIAGINCSALGNIFLAQYPQRQVLQCSRKFTLDQIEALKAECLTEASSGTVFISAAISEGEKQISRALRAAGFHLIILMEQGFPAPDSPNYKYFKPAGIYFEACAAGKLLLIEPAAELFERIDIVAKVTAKAGLIPHDIPRYRFLALNYIAESMSTS